MKIAVILGTRPEIIKMSPVIKELERRGAEYFVLHTGQHYDFTMDKIFFEELDLDPEMMNLDIGSGAHGEMTGRLMGGIEKILLERKPDVVLVQGDTNTVLAGSLVAVKLHIKLGHIEAGLRSYDRRMPEEYNRIVSDHVANYLFAPTALAKERLEKENISKEDILYFDEMKKQEIVLTGNTIVDAVLLHKDKRGSGVLEGLGIEKGQYFLVTAHREETVDFETKLSSLFDGFRALIDKYGYPVVYPVHPRTRKRIKEFGLLKKIESIKGLKLIDPVGFLDLISLEANSALVLTDSGGIQEEACSLGIPCVVLREKSDRTESIEVGAAVLAGHEVDSVVDSVERMMKVERGWPNPFGDGSAAKKIVDMLYKE